MSGILALAVSAVFAIIIFLIIAYVVDYLVQDARLNKLIKLVIGLVLLLNFLSGSFGYAPLHLG